MRIAKCLCLLALLIGNPSIGWAEQPEHQNPEERRMIAIIDAKADHIYPQGQTPELKATPIIHQGQLLNDLIQQISISSTVKPYRVQNMDQCQNLLLDGKDFYGRDKAVVMDFWRTKDPTQSAMTVQITFKKPVMLSTVMATTQSHNHQYRFDKMTVQAKNDAGQTLTLPVAQVTSQKFCGMSANPANVQSLTLQLYTSYKINLTDIKCYGLPLGQTFEQVPSHLDAQWFDFTNKPLTDKFKVPVYQTTTIIGPSDQCGYYGLKFSPVHVTPDLNEKEFGFVILPSEPITTKPASNPFGMVHHQLQDKRLGVAWSKTRTTTHCSDKTTFDVNAKAWAQSIKQCRDLGYEELPMAGFGWHSDATEPISDQQLQNLYKLMKGYFQATPDLLYWELGREENLQYRKHKTDWPYYWDNLDKKVRIVRQAVNEVNPDIQLIFQIAELDEWSLNAFLSNKAASTFDILSLHPYAWAQFPTPEKWMPDFLKQVRQMMTDNGLDMPIWYTEIGAPHDGNPGGFFGYPVNRSVRGLPRDEMTGFMIKCHVYALADKVPVIFWYNYKDRDHQNHYPEDHFGLLDYWMYPKPAYAAYSTMTRMIDDLPFIKSEKQGNARIFTFGNDKRICHVIWNYRWKPIEDFNLGALTQSTPVANRKIVNTVGTPIDPDTQTIKLSEHPIFVELTQ